MFFYLGTHEAGWLQRSPVPLFVSVRRLMRYRQHSERTPSARCVWALDSGGFTELSTYGEWTVDPDLYGGAVYRFIDDVGWPVFCAPQDWMCEPSILAKTGLTVGDHQALTIENLLYLREEFPHAPWLPVLQGWRVEDYLAHVEAYRAAGVDLAAEDLVGLGSVCRRQSTGEIDAIVSTLAALDIRLHGFGVKTAGLARYGRLLESADSLAWSAAARWGAVRLPGCEHRGPCSSCLRWALRWRERVLEALTEPAQEVLF